MFKILKGQDKARCGIIKTAYGEIQTPFFMPDATRGYVKGLSRADLEMAGVGPMVVNTFHLYLQPGIDIIKKLVKPHPNPPLKRGGKKISPSFEEGDRGRLHPFMNWPHPLLSDSGGFQVFSLIHKNPKMGKIFDDKVIFKSPLDGSQHELTPEKSIQIQFDLGVDMMVCLDDCPPNDFVKNELENSVKRTIAWAKRCRKEYEKQVKKRKLKDKERPLLFSVIQGGAEKDLRKYCADELIKIGFDGYGFGAMPVDENGNFLDDVLKYTAELIPENALRFALGIGTPDDIVKCVSYGWDMFDCVIPTREARHGKLFLGNNYPLSQRGSSRFSGAGGFFDGTTLSNLPYFLTRTLTKRASLCKLHTIVPASEKSPPFGYRSGQALTPLCKGGKWYDTININNSKFAKDFSPINKNSKLPELQNYSKAYLHHLFKMKEPLGARLATLNNLEFYMRLMQSIRRHSHLNGL